MNPYAIISPLLLAKIKKMKSLFHRGQLRGSLGLSLGCGIRMISLSLPVLCFKKETTYQFISIREYHLVLRYLYSTLLPAELCLEHGSGNGLLIPKGPLSLEHRSAERLTYKGRTNGRTPVVATDITNPSPEHLLRELNVTRA